MKTTVCESESECRDGACGRYAGVVSGTPVPLNWQQPYVMFQERVAELLKIYCMMRRIEA